MRLLLVFFLLFQVNLVHAAASGNTESAPVAQVEKKEPIRYRENSIITFSLIFRIILISAVLLFFAFLALYLVKRFYFGEMATKEGSTIVVKEVKRVTPKTLLYMVNVRGKSYLLAQSADRIIKLDEFVDDKPQQD